MPISDTDIFFKYILPIFSGFGVFSFGWNMYDYFQKRIGFLRPKLQCSYESHCNEPYLVSKTKVENSSKRPIYLDHALLLIVDKPISFEDGIALVVRKMSENNLIEERFLDEQWDVQLEEVIHSINNNNIPSLEEDNFIIKSLPYYFKLHARVGSDAQMSTTHIQRVRHSGIYSIYFAVIGKGWYRRRLWYKLFLFPKKDPSQARSAHDEVIVR